VIRRGTALDPAIGTSGPGPGEAGAGAGAGVSGRTSARPDDSGPRRVDPAVVRGSVVGCCGADPAAAPLGGRATNRSTDAGSTRPRSTSAVSIPLGPPCICGSGPASAAGTGPHLPDSSARGRVGGAARDRRPCCPPRGRSVSRLIGPTSDLSSRRGDGGPDACGQPMPHSAVGGETSARASVDRFRRQDLWPAACGLWASEGQGPETQAPRRRPRDRGARRGDARATGRPVETRARVDPLKNEGRHQLGGTGAATVARDWGESLAPLVKVHLT
jgi:hypothetical protein